MKIFHFAKNLAEMTAERFFDTQEFNLRSGFNLVKALLPGMQQRGYGRIVNIASVDMAGRRGRADYSAAKAAVAGWTRALALEQADNGVVVNCIAPGQIETLGVGRMDENLQRDAPEVYKEELDWYVGRNPMKRRGTPLEIANAALFLASDECSYMTGHMLPISGGMMAHL